MKDGREPEHRTPARGSSSSAEAAATAASGRPVIVAIAAAFLLLVSSVGAWASFDDTPISDKDALIGLPASAESMGAIDISEGGESGLFADPSSNETVASGSLSGSDLLGTPLLLLALVAGAAALWFRQAPSREAAAALLGSGVITTVLTAFKVLEIRSVADGEGLAWGGILALLAAGVIAAAGWSLFRAAGPWKYLGSHTPTES